MDIIPLFLSNLSIIIPAGAILVILAYSFLLWITGDRAGAKNQMMSAFTVALTMIAIGGAYILGNMILESISSGVGSPFDTIKAAWNGLYNPNMPDTGNAVYISHTGQKLTAVGEFNYIYRKAVDWIVYVGVTQAAWGLIPYIGYAISEALRSATLWQNWVFSIASTTFIALEWFARILYFLQPWLLAFGAGLAATPRFKTLGGVLLSIYLVAGAGTVLIADYSYSYLNQYAEYVNKAPDASHSSPALWGGGGSSLISIAGDADKSAQGFMWATVLAMVGTLIMGVLTAGVSRVFEGLPVLFRPI